MPQRFASRREIARVIRNGRRIILPLGRVSVLPASGPAGRVLFVVPKTVSKKSTVRNRIRRILVAWAREWNIARRIRQDLVVFVNPALGASRADAIRAAAEAMAGELARFGLATLPRGRRSHSD